MERGNRRLPAETRPGGVHLRVADLDRSLEWYEGLLGMRVLRTGNEVVELGVSGDDRVMVGLHERPGADPAPGHGRLGLYHFAVLLPDRPSLGRILARLAERSVPLGAADHRVSEALYLQDPDGLGVELYADRPRSGWVEPGRGLVLTTEPLDLDDLARSGSDGPWSGMPPGTTIGHVHLHVGDLARAEAFYHDALGLDVTVRGYAGALFLSAGGYHHHLGVNRWAGAGAQPPPESEAQLLEWQLVLPSAADATGALERLAGAGFPVETTTGGGCTRDPWGTPLRLRAGHGGP